MRSCLQRSTKPVKGDDASQVGVFQSTRGGPITCCVHMSCASGWSNRDNPLALSLCHSGCFSERVSFVAPLFVIAQGRTPVIHELLERRFAH